jgi:fucose permease
MDAGAHTIVARVSEDVPRGINRLNVCFAAGAVAGPLWSGGVFAVDADARPLVFVSIAALAFAAGVVVVTSSLPERRHSPSDEPSATRLFAGMTRLVWAMGVVLFLYVGAEFGLGSWVATYADEEFEAGIFLGGVITAGYWGSLMVGRLISGALLGRGIPAQNVLIGSIFAGLICSTGIALANESFALAVAAAFATGLAFGPVWPAAMAIATAGRASAAPAAMVTIGNSGGFVFPWLQGRLLVEQGATTGIALSAVLCAAMLLVAWRARPSLR